MSIESKTDLSIPVVSRTRATLGDEPPSASPRASDRFYLLVFEGDRSRMFELPAGGEVLIGRGEAAGLRLDENGVSRKHACVTMTDGEARLGDLDSQNGT